MFKSDVHELVIRAKRISVSADCPRAACGCAIQNVNGDIVTGFNYHASNGECVIERGHCVDAVHAEAAAIFSAAMSGIRLIGSTAVSLERPCNRCLQALHASGIKKVYYVNDYHSKEHGDEYCSKSLMRKLGIEKYDDTSITLQ